MSQSIFLTGGFVDFQVRCLPLCPGEQEVDHSSIIGHHQPGTSNISQSNSINDIVMTEKRSMCTSVSGVSGNTLGSCGKLNLPSLSQPCLPVCVQGPTKILPFIYLGSQQDVMDQDILKKYGIDFVLNLSTNCPKPDFLKEEHFMRIPVHDSYSEKLLPYFEDAFQFLDKVREASGVALIHCLAGISRSPTLVIAYIMHYLHMSQEEAYRYVKEKRPSISPNFNFLGQLLEYEKHLKMKRHQEKSEYQQKMSSLFQQARASSFSSPEHHKKNVNPLQKFIHHIEPNKNNNNNNNNPDFPTPLMTSSRSADYNPSADLANNFRAYSFSCSTSINICTKSTPTSTKAPMTSGACDNPGRIPLASGPENFMPQQHQPLPIKEPFVVYGKRRLNDDEKDKEECAIKFPPSNLNMNMNIDMMNMNMNKQSRSGLDLVSLQLLRKPLIKAEELPSPSTELSKLNFGSQSETTTTTSLANSSIAVASGIESRAGLTLGLPGFNLNMNTKFLTHPDRSKTNPLFVDSPKLQRSESKDVEMVDEKSTNQRRDSIMSNLSHQSSSSSTWSSSNQHSGHALSVENPLFGANLPQQCIRPQYPRPQSSSFPFNIKHSIIKKRYQNFYQPRKECKNNINNNNNLNPDTNMNTNLNLNTKAWKVYHHCHDKDSQLQDNVVKKDKSESESENTNTNIKNSSCSNIPSIISQKFQGFFKNSKRLTLSHVTRSSRSKGANRKGPSTGLAGCMSASFSANLSTKGSSPLVENKDHVTLSSLASSSLARAQPNIYSKPPKSKSESAMLSDPDHNFGTKPKIVANDTNTRFATSHVLKSSVELPISKSSYIVDPDTSPVVPCGSLSKRRDPERESLGSSSSLEITVN